MAQLFAGCPIRLHLGRARPVISSPITIPYNATTSGGRTWGLGKRNQFGSAPYVPTSHSFTGRLIGTIRRESLDQILFWNGVDLEEKLGEFQDYCHAHRVHQSLNLKTPDEAGWEKTTY